MSIEAMKALTDVETQSAADKKAAEASAAAQIAEATRAGNALKLESRTAAEGEAKEMLLAAEEKSKATTEEILAEAATACEATKTAARAHLNAAAAHIAEKVVNI